jgi:hypothetical protein
MGHASHISTRRKLKLDGLLALAFLALLVVLARPICDAYELGAATSSHSEGSGPCCASIEDRTGAASSAASLPAVKTSPPLAMVSVVLPAWRSAALVLAAPPDRPPASRRYHARSARILL